MSLLEPTIQSNRESPRRVKRHQPRAPIPTTDEFKRAKSAEPVREIATFQEDPAAKETPIETLIL
jgi:hypothetical protein